MKLLLGIICLFSLSIMVKAGPAKGGNDVNGQPLIPELAESLKTCDEPGANLPVDKGETPPETPEEGGVDCKDNYKQCATAGLCDNKTYKKMMNEVCKKTCKICS